ncbi:MAG: hypothetical protein K6T16_00960 [Candidatus Pacearchaeota archaeon]|nr:hypothetical protein [Candidatus Pacearchaeota archaeon]
MEKSSRDILEETIILIIASLFLGFLISLELVWPKISIDEYAFLEGSLISLLMLSTFVIAQKVVAYHLDCKIKTKLISFRKYWFQSYKEGRKAELPFEFPAWLLLPLAIALLTNGLIKWLAILNFDIEPKATRARRKWQELTESDIGKIAISGPIAVIALGLLFKIANFNEYASLCAWLAFLALVPIGLGFKILNSTRITWVFSLLFSFFILLLMNISAPFATLVMALLLAAMITIAYYTLYEE